MRRMFNVLLGGKRNNRRDDRGMSFVEVLCAVAIFSMIAVTIGTVIVVSARTYRKGVSETSVQQEAQLAANNIGNIVKDACSVAYGAQSTQFIQNGTKLMVEADGSPKMQSADATELYISVNNDTQYCIKYDIANKALVYAEKQPSDTTFTSAQVLAKNVTDFSADTTDFENSRTIKLNMTVVEPATGKSIPMAYTMTSRNEEAAEIEFTMADTPTVIFLETNPILVPGETYQIPIAIVGKMPEGGLGSEIVTKDSADTEITDDNKRLKVSALTTDYVEIKVPKYTSGETARVEVFGKNADSTKIASSVGYTTIRIRQVKAIDVKYAVDRTGTADGSYEAAGAKYTCYADVDGSNLPKSAGSSWDNGYQKAQAVYWSYKLTADGNTYTYKKEQKIEAGGTLGVEETYSDKTGAESYVKIVTYKDEVDRPYITFELMQAMPSDFVLEVTATSRHALGQNKASSRYPEYPDPDTKITGTAIIDARDTLIKNEFEITLEPNEDYSCNLNSLGGRLVESKTVCELRGNSSSSTKAVYKAADNAVKITIGGDETGGQSGQTAYTFQIDVKENGNLKKTITVHVRRLDVISMEVVKNLYDANGSVMEWPAYDFRVRYNVSNGIYGDAMQEASKYLIIDNDEVPNALATRLTWEFTKDDQVVSDCCGSVILIAGKNSADKGMIIPIGSYREETEYFKIINIKPARVEKITLGTKETWTIKQVAEIDVRPVNGALPLGTKLTVTAEALHPLGKVNVNGTERLFNKTGNKYGNPVASQYIEGDSIMVVQDTVIVEPGEGTDVLYDTTGAVSSQVLNVPIKTSVPIDHINVTLSGNKSSTRLADYTSAGKTNPYLDNSKNGVGTWYLGLVIGTDETGQDTGLIDVTITAYTDKNEKQGQSETAKAQLAIRRVTNVQMDATVKNKQEGKDVILTYNGSECPYHSGTCRHLSYDYINVGEEITLSASATGYSGTKYFARQRDEDKEKYQAKSPYAVRWDIYDSNGKVIFSYKKGDDIKTLNNASAYVTLTDESNYGESITMKLKKRLPNGSEIRATSLHAAGNNRSGKKYEDVIDTLYVKIIDTEEDVDMSFLDNVMRGQEFGNSEDRKYEFPDATGNYCVYNNANNAGYGWGSWYYRTREILGEDENGNTLYGEWSMYHRNQINDSGEAGMRLNQEDTQIFLPDHMYQLELAFMCIDQGSKTIKWPRDKALLAAGTGFEGFSIEGGVSTNKKSDYTNTYNIGRGSIRFSADKVVDTDGDGVADDYLKCIGSVDEPITDATYTTPMYGHSLYWNHYQHKSYTRWEIMKNNRWVVVTPSGLSAVNSQKDLKITKSTGAQTGIYRVSNGIRYKNESAEWRVWIGDDPWDNGGNYYKQLFDTDYLLCGNAGRTGYIYYEVQ